MSEERELLKELSTKDMVSYYYPGLINRIKELLAEPERDKVDFKSLSEMGLKRLQCGTLVLQEGCSKSPTVILAENGELLKIIKYKKLLEIRSFIDEILNYADTPQIGVDNE